VVNRSTKSSIRLWFESFFFVLPSWKKKKKRNLIRTHNSSWVILKELEGKSLDIYWAVSNLFCLSRLESIWFLPHSDLVVETIENGVSLFRYPLFYLCFESLGLDITSVILNCFKMVATYLLLFRSTETIDSPVIHFWSELVKLFRQIHLTFFFYLFELDPFNFYTEDILTKLFQLIDWH